MGAYYIRDRIQRFNTISEIRLKNDREIIFEYKVNNKVKEYKVYCPTREDYAISVEVIDRAIRDGYNMVVHDNWIFPTAVGMQYANSKGIPVYKAPALISKIQKNEPIGIHSQ